MPASIEGSLDSAYVAPNTFLMKRDIRKKIFKRYKEETLFDWAVFTNRTVVTDNERFNWHELGYLYGYAQVQSSSAIAYTAGTKVTIVLTADSHTENGTKSAGKDWDEVQLVINGTPVRGWVQSKDPSTPYAHSYVIKPIRQIDNITGGSLNALANLYVAFYSSAKADGTDQPTSMIRKPDLYYNYTKIVGTQFVADGSESANKAEVEVDGKPFYYLQGVEDAANKHNLDINFAFILGERWDGSLTDDNNAAKPVRTTAGIDSMLRDYGNPFPYSGTPDYSTLTGIEKILSRERAPDQLMMINGVNFDISLDTVIKGKLDYNGMNYSAFGTGDAKQRAVDFGFDSFRFSKRTYHKNVQDFMNYLPITGFSGSPYPDMSFLLPIDRVANPAPTGDADREMDTICVRYKENDKQNRYVKHWTRDVTITNKDQIEFNHLSEVGLQLAMLNQTIRVYAQ